MIAHVAAAAFAMSLHAAPELPADSRLSQAIRTYEEGSFAAAKDLLQLLLAEPDLTAVERGHARVYLAAALLELGATSQSRAQLVLAIRESPEVRPDEAK